MGRRFSGFESAIRSRRDGPLRAKILGPTEMLSKERWKKQMAGGGWHGGGRGGGGSDAECAAGLRCDAGEHHQRPDANRRGRVLWGSEARFDPGSTGTGSAADRGGGGGRPEPGAEIGRA